MSFSNANGRPRKIKVFRTDNRLVTNAIKTFCDLPENQIKLLPCIPYEHDTIGLIERWNRTVQEGIVKALFNKPHLSFKHWGMAALDFGRLII